MAKQRSKVGLTETGQINWLNPVNTVIIELADSGLYGRVIAECTGLTIGQVYSRCHMLGISLKDFRSGKSEKAMEIIRQYDVVNDTTANATIEKATKRTHQTLKLQGYRLFD